MARKTSIAVHITGDVKDLNRAFQSAESKAEQFGRRMNDIGNKLTLGVTLPIVAMGTKAVMAASDLQEAMDKTDAIFAESARAVKEWSETSAEAMGLASAEALDAAGNLGNMMQSAGLAAAEAASMSMELVQLAADMGSLNNVDPTEMLVKMQAALAGEAEPLRRFGVNISAARVEAKALEMGLAETADQITEAMKVTARYAIIMEDSALAHGNFADTADGAANQTRILRANITNLSAELGTKLLPTVERALSEANDLASGFAGLSDQTQMVIVRVGILAAAAGPLAKLIGLLTSVGTKVGAVSGAMLGLGTAAGAAAAGVMGTAGALIYFGAQGFEARTEAVGGAWKRFGDILQTAGFWGDYVAAAIEGALRAAQKIKDIAGGGGGGGSATRPLNPPSGSGPSGGGSVRAYDTGGVVPGPRGAPQLAVVHGGETILPTHKNAMAGTTINIINPTTNDLNSDISKAMTAVRLLGVV